ncbi:hypothetical protein VNO77_05757 [Canavalia gladiata]|uniref:Uncharacterized protein n=1 Tax=Canavalia gladiata TaxID=3824 RepID=A0AAN9N5I0_CANGL
MNLRNKKHAKRRVSTTQVHIDEALRIATLALAPHSRRSRNLKTTIGVLQPRCLEKRRLRAIETWRFPETGNDPLYLIVISHLYVLSLLFSFIWNNHLRG